MIEIIEFVESELTRDQAISILKLTIRVWPKEKSLEQIAEEVIESARCDEKDQPATRFAIVDAGEVIAHARTFVREIFWLADDGKDYQSANVLALASVCTDPDHRGKGLGVEIVKRAFDQVGRDVPVSLFQTGVAKFYEKLGARVVQNRFVNKLNLENPDANPWKDQQVMIYPADADWPTAEIDLNGPGY